MTKESKQKAKKVATDFWQYVLLFVDMLALLVDNFASLEPYLGEHYALSYLVARLLLSLLRGVFVFKKTA